MRPLIHVESDRPPLTPADFIGTGCAWLTSFVHDPEDRGSIGYRYQQVEKLRQDLWRTFRAEYVTWLRRQGSGIHQTLPQINDLVLVKDVLAWKGDGWPMARIIDIRKPTDAPRTYELEIVPTEELRKQPQLAQQPVQTVVEQENDP